MTSRSPCNSMLLWHGLLGRKRRVAHPEVLRVHLYKARGQPYPHSARPISFFLFLKNRSSSPKLNSPSLRPSPRGRGPSHPSSQVVAENQRRVGASVLPGGGGGCVRRPLLPLGLLRGAGGALGGVVLVGPGDPLQQEQVAQQQRRLPTQERVTNRPPGRHSGDGALPTSGEAASEVLHAGALPANREAVRLKGRAVAAALSNQRRGFSSVVAVHQGFF